MKPLGIINRDDFSLRYSCIDPEEPDLIEQYLHICIKIYFGVSETHNYFIFCWEDFYVVAAGILLLLVPWYLFVCCMLVYLSIHILFPFSLSTFMSWLSFLTYSLSKFFVPVVIWTQFLPSRFFRQQSWIYGSVLCFSVVMMG